MGWLIVAGLFFLWCIISAVKDIIGSGRREAAPTVIHNNIHIINSPVNSSTSASSAPSLREPKEHTSEEGLFGSRVRF